MAVIQAISNIITGGRAPPSSTWDWVFLIFLRTSSIPRTTARRRTGWLIARRRKAVCLRDQAQHSILGLVRHYNSSEKITRRYNLMVSAFRSRNGAVTGVLRPVPKERLGLGLRPTITRTDVVLCRADPLSWTSQSRRQHIPRSYNHVESLVLAAAGPRGPTPA